MSKVCATCGKVLDESKDTIFIEDEYYKHYQCSDDYAFKSTYYESKYYFKGSRD
ncbi:MAG: hypothetical protein WC307_06190 [Candidatus Nanoarchaeia archaeon]|jgi:hypothetical protein